MIVVENNAPKLSANRRAGTLAPKHYKRKWPSACMTKNLCSGKIPAMRAFLPLSLLLFPLCARAQSFSNWSGPLPVQNQRPYQSAFLHFEPTSPDVLARGETSYALAFHVANDLLIPNPSNGSSVHEDFETGRAEFSYLRGIGKRWEIGAQSSFLVRDGGLLDGPISFYHRLFGLAGNGQDNPQGRDNIPRGQDILFFQDANGNGVNQGGAFGLGDTTFQIRRELSSGRFASALRVGVKIPTGNGHKILGSGGTDVGIGLDARHSFGSRFALFGDVGAFAYSSSSIPNASKTGTQLGLGFELRAGHRDSFIAQIDAQSRTVRTGNGFADRIPVGASVGYKRRLSERQTAFVSFTENGDYVNYHAPYLSNIGPDLTLSAGLEWRR